MRSLVMVATLFICGAGAFHPALAQKVAPPITRDTDHDGVPDPRDDCPRTVPNTRVNARGCPDTAAPVAASAAAATGAASGTAGAARPDSTHRPAGTAASTTVSQSATAAAPAVTDPTETAGFWIPAYTGHTDAEQLEYMKTLVLKLDSAVMALVETYRNTSGNPVAGASDPGRLTRREKDRWLRCRNIGSDIRTMSDAADVLRDSVVGGAAVQRSVAALSDALQGLNALESCDVINRMIETPERTSPWQANYENEARNFYRDWYGQLRTAHNAGRDLARVVSPLLPAAKRFTVPAAIATTPPYSGAGR